MESARGIAALLVVAYHASKVRPAGDGQEYLSHLRIGVPIFFLISGFLLFRPFVVARLEGRRVAVGPYGLRRVLRIVPGYWVALTCVVVAGSHSAQIRADPLTYYGFAQSFSDDTVLGGIGQAWTLSSELLFYGLLPLLALLLAVGRRPGEPRWGREVLALGALAVGAYGYTSHMSGTVPEGVDTWELFVLPRFLGHFALGMALALIAVWVGPHGPGSRPRPLQLLLDRPGLTWLLVPPGFVLAVKGDLPLAAVDVVDGLVAAALLWPAVMARPGQGLAGRVLGARWLLFAGTVSYGIYLYHYAFLTRLDSNMGEGNWVGLFVVASACAAAAGYVSWRLVEQPAINWGKRRIAGRTTAPAPVASSPLAAQRAD